jgi:hypothetical protein
MTIVGHFATQLPKRYTPRNATKNGWMPAVDRGTARSMRVSTRYFDSSCSQILEWRSRPEALHPRNDREKAAEAGRKGGELSHGSKS